MRFPRCALKKCGTPTYCWLYHNHYCRTRRNRPTTIPPSVPLRIVFLLCSTLRHIQPHLHAGLLWSFKVSILAAPVCHTFSWQCLFRSATCFLPSIRGTGAVEFHGKSVAPVCSGTLLFASLLPFDFIRHFMSFLTPYHAVPWKHASPPPGGLEDFVSTASTCRRLCYICSNSVLETSVQSYDQEKYSSALDGRNFCWILGKRTPRSEWRRQCEPQELPYVVRLK